jgi:hypothetical protein
MLSRSHLVVTATLLLTILPGIACADEHFFGYVRGAETLPAGHVDLYQFVTLREGKHAGDYRAWDFSTEAEYGITDKFQMSLSLEQHIFDFDGVDELPDGTFYRFGGAEIGVKYRFSSVFKDGYGLALHAESGFLRYDDVGGIIQEMIFIAPTLIYQKNFLDDTLILASNAGVQFAWGKEPAEEYDRELSLKAGLGLTYRFAPNWFIGAEAHLVSEYPKFDLGFHEHTVLFAGPSLHYGTQKWWATLSWAYQVWGSEVDAVESGRAFAEESQQEFRLKVGFSF